MPLPPGAWNRPTVPGQGRKVIGSSAFMRHSNECPFIFMSDCLTDNPNRTFGDVRSCFTKTKSKIGTQGSVSHMFDHLVILSFKHDDEDAVLEALMEDDVDVHDIENEDGMLTVFTQTQDYFKAKQALSNAFADIDFEVDEIQFIPQTEVPIEGENIEQFERFLGLLNDFDDVQNVFHNAQYDAE